MTDAGKVPAEQLSSLRWLESTRRGGSQFLGPHVFSRPRDGARAELSVIKSDQYLFLLVVLGPNLLLLLVLLLCCPLLFLRQAHPSPRHLNQSIAPFLVFDRLR